MIHMLHSFVWIDFDKAKANNQHKTGSDLDVQEHKHDNMSCRYLSKKRLGFGGLHHFAGGGNAMPSFYLSSFMYLAKSFAAKVQVLCDCLRKNPL